MRRGTTPTHIFTLPFGEEMIQTIKVYYAQGGEVVLAKDKESCLFEGNSVMVSLSQEETLLFDENVWVEIQIRVLTLGGQALASDIMRVNCLDVLSDEVLA